jgi:glycosyltransferase involved in cell wall biosynthesis
VKAQSPSVADKIVVVPNAIDEVFLKETKRPRDEETKSRSEAKTARGGDEGKLREQGTAEAEPRRVAAATNGPKDQEPKGLRDQGTRAVRILYVGRIHPEKGLLLLANALRLLAARDQETKRPKDEEPEFAAADGDGVSPVGAGRGQTSDWECVLVGPVRESEGGGGDGFAEELKRELEGLPVRFEAPVYDPAALAKIYDQADVFVYPSAAVTGEAMPLAPLEAMARGLVPVVSDLKVFRAYLESDVNGVVFDNRGHEKEANLAIALGELVADPKKRERMGAAAWKTAEKFSTVVIADKYLQLFTKMISGR